MARKNALPGNRVRAVPAPRSPRDADDLRETAATGCPLTAAIRALGGKWSLICLYWLEIEPRRFGELRRLMPEVSHKVLTQTLRDLEREGLVVRTVQRERPASVAYRLSEHGGTVVPVLGAVRAFGRGHLVARQPR